MSPTPVTTPPLSARRPRRALLVASCAVVAGAALLAYCWQREQQSQISSEATTERPAVLPIVLSQIPGASPLSLGKAVDGLIAKVDPRGDNWDTEVLSEAAAGQLRELKSLIAKGVFSGKDISAIAENLVPLATGDVQSEALRPSDLVEVFRDPSAIVLRRRASLAAEKRQPPAAAPGRDRLAKHLAELVDSLAAHDAAPHGELKVFRIELLPGEFATEVLYHASGHGRDGARQQNAHWRCRWKLPHDSQPPKLTAIAVMDFEEVYLPDKSGIKLTDATAHVLGNDDAFRDQLCRGTDYWRGRLESAYGIDPLGNVGLALGDVNGDGLDDVFVCQQGGLPNRLFVQQTDGTLRDVSAESGVDWMEVTRAALLLDLDNDGDQDLVLSQGWYAMIMENDGRGRFTRRMQRRSMAHLYSVAAADYDLDGDIDLYFCGRNPAREQTEAEGVLGMPIPYHDANNGGPSMLWRNDGSFEFTDVTREVGMDVNNHRFSYAACWEDFDNDGDQDLYVANDFGRDNLYENRGGRFVDVAPAAGVDDISAGMSAAWGDYDNDGLMDIYVGNMFSSAGNRVTYQQRFRSGESSSLEQFRRHARGNTLFRNTGDRTFTDESVASAVTMGRWAWGSKFVDLNNDGLLDIYVANGFLTTQDTGDL